MNIAFAKSIRALKNVGVREGIGLQKKQTIQVSNIIFFNIGLCCIVVALVSTSQVIVAIIYWVLTLNAWLMIWVNSIYRSILARVLFTIILNLGIFLTTLNYVSNTAHAADRFFFFVNIGLTGIIFSFKEIRWTFAIYLMVLTLLIGFDPLRSFLTTHYFITIYPPFDSIASYTKITLAGVTLVLCFFYMQFIYDDFTNTLEDRLESPIQEIQNGKKKLERNITELRKSNTELDQFVYNVSHILRAPLASVLGLVWLG